MTTEERRRQLKSKLVLGIAAAAVIAGGAAVLMDRFTPSKKHMDPAQYFRTGAGGVALTVNGTLSETAGILADGGRYLPYGAVASSVNPSVFYDANEDKLIVTTPTEKTAFAFAGGRTAGGEAVEQDGAVYVAASYLQQVTDADFAEYTEPDRVVVTTEYSYPAMAFAEAAPIRYRAGIKSPILVDAEEGLVVQVTDVDEHGEALGDKIRGWTHVRTEDGYSGYVQDRYLTEPRLVTKERSSPIGEYTSLRLDGTVNMVFHQTDSEASNHALTESLTGVTGPNVIAPTWFYLDSEEGAVISLASKSYVDTAHAAGLQVWAVLNDFDGGISSASSTGRAISTDTARSAIIREVMAGIRESGADGLNLDIELVKAESAEDYLELIREFSVECRNAGIVLSIDNYVPTFTNYLRRSEQARVADYLVVMCYDEHTAGSSRAGSVASLPFVRKGIEDTAAQAGAEKTIAAIPFFTRMWETSAGGISSKSYGMSGAAARMEELGMTAEWNEEMAQNYASKTEGGTTWQIWVEDAASIGRKMEVIGELECAGVAEWKLGLETADIWGVISSHL